MQSIHISLLALVFSSSGVRVDLQFRRVFLFLFGDEFWMDLIMSKWQIVCPLLVF
jgi:hypothetical protein